MTDEVAREALDIIQKQTEALSATKRTPDWSKPLPPLGKAPTIEEPQTTRTSTAATLIQKRYSIEEDFDRMSMLAVRRSTPLASPLQPDHIFNGQLLEEEEQEHEEEGYVDEDDIDSRPSTSGECFETVEMKMASIPSKIPDIEGLSSVLDTLSHRRLNKILETCRLYDQEDRSYLSEPTLLKCIGEVIPSSHSRDSPWRIFLHILAPEGQMIEYERLCDLIRKHITSATELPYLQDLLAKKKTAKLLNLPSRPSSSQEERERGRVMMEIEILLMRHPELDIDRLKMATVQNVIEPSEMSMLLELYGLKDHFNPFIRRLFSCFRTHDDQFHYSAFLGCLENVKPYQIRSSAPAMLTQKPIWLTPPLGKLTPSTASKSPISESEEELP